MSMPDQFMIHATEGKMSTGPDGTQVSPACPFVIKRLADPLNKSFEQVRHWIMEIFQLNEETHEITLQHILYVRNNLLAPPSNVLIDIVGDDSWRAFLNVAWRHVGAFILLVRWSAKQTTSVSKAIDNDVTTVADEDPAITDESDDGSWPTCKHDKPCTAETLWDSQGQGRMLYRCPLFVVNFLWRMFIKDSKQSCGFTRWLDKKLSEKVTVHTNLIVEIVASLQQQVDNLKCELDELHRCHQKRSRGEAVISHGDKCPCGNIPCDLASCDQDEKPRPSQIRRLANGNKTPI